MGEGTDDLIELLGLLESCESLSTAELASAMEVSETTVRRRIARLRELGWAVAIEPGVGYRLRGSGTALPPLVLDDQEATAVTVALRRALHAPVALIEEGTVRALAKIEQVLPDRVRQAVDAHDVGGTAESEQLRAALMAVARAIRGTRVLQFRMVERGRIGPLRQVEPISVRSGGGQWLLVGYDRDLNRVVASPVSVMQEIRVTEIRFRERAPHPSLTRQVAPEPSPAPVVAVVEVQAPPRQVQAHLPPGVGVLEPLEQGGCRLVISGSDLASVVRQLVLLPDPFTVIEPEDLRSELRAVAAMLSGV